MNDIIIGPKNYGMRCDACRHYWAKLYGSSKICPKCNSEDITLRVIFGHGTYQEINKKVNE